MALLNGLTSFSECFDGLVTLTAIWLSHGFAVCAKSFFSNAGAIPVRVCLACRLILGQNPVCILCEKDFATRMSRRISVHVPVAFHIHPQWYMYPASLRKDAHVVPMKKNRILRKIHRSYRRRSPHLYWKKILRRYTCFLCLTLDTRLTIFLLFCSCCFSTVGCQAHISALRLVRVVMVQLTVIVDSMNARHTWYLLLFFVCTPWLMSDMLYRDSFWVAFICQADCPVPQPSEFLPFVAYLHTELQFLNIAIC